MPDPETRLRHLLDDVSRTYTALLALAQDQFTDDLPTPDRAAAGQPARALAARLADSALRPLTAALGGRPSPAAATPNATTGSQSNTQESDAQEQDPPELVWELARRATRLRLVLPGSLELAEATAALQGLALALADDPAARRQDLTELQSGLAE